MAASYKKEKWPPTTKTAPPKMAPSYKKPKITSPKILNEQYIAIARTYENIRKVDYLTSLSLNFNNKIAKVKSIQKVKL